MATGSHAGSSSVTPVMEKLAEGYEAVNKDVTVEVQQRTVMWYMPASPVSGWLSSLLHEAINKQTTINKN